MTHANASAAAASQPAASAARSSKKPRTRKQPQAPPTITAICASQPPHLPCNSLLQFERLGYLVTKQLLPAQELHKARECVQQVIKQRRLEALKHRVRVLCPDYKAAGSIKSEAQALSLIQQQGNSELGFLQFFNLHRREPAIAQLVRSKQLVGAAAQLLGAKRLRLYQDCVFLKEPGYAETNWHSDLRMAPLDTNAFITAWLPLRPISGAEGDSGLVFAAGSHRDFALPFWHDLQGRDLEDRGYQLDDTGAMAVGDVSWHHGWTLHAASPQPPNTPPRLALAVSFFADGSRLLARQTDASVYKHMLHDEDAESYGSWLGQLKDGELAKHPQLPVVYP